MAISTKKGDYKKYSVGGSPLRSFAYADTIEEAKEAGMKIAKKEAWRGKYNILYDPMKIYKRRFATGPFYDPTEWLIIVPLRGTGRKSEDIIAEIKRRFGTEPLKWVKRKK